jgi:hypothetical protein
LVSKAPANPLLKHQTQSWQVSSISEIYKGKATAEFTYTYREWREAILKAANRQITIECIFTLLLFVLALSYTCHSTQAQTDISFTTTDKFEIPASNGTITFAFNGTYTHASLVNDTWTFVNLRLDYSQPLEKLEVSTQNSNVTIIYHRTFNATLRGVLLSYAVEGQGKQTFNIGLPLTEGEWSVLIEDDFKGEGDGWHVAPDATLTITDAKSTATIWYFGYPEDFDVDDDTPFYLQHSVAIATATALAVTATMGLVIRRKTQKASNKTGWQQAYMTMNNRRTQTKTGRNS